MDSVDRLRRLVEGMPEGASVVLPVDCVRGWLDGPHDTLEPDMTVAQVAEFYGRSPSTIRRWIRDERLRAYFFQGREYRITDCALREFIQQERGHPRARNTAGAVEEPQN